MWATFLQGFALGFPAASQPGPFQAFLLSQSIKRGWRRALPAALAPLLSDGPIIALVLLLLTQMPLWLLDGLRLGGGLFLFKLAWDAWRDFRRFEPLAVDEDAGRQNLLQAALLNVLNPNPYIFWGAVGGPLLLAAWRAAPAHALFFLLGFYGTLVGGFALLIVLFGRLGRLNDNVARSLTLLSAIALFSFGVFQFVTVLR
jgi:threonine/homoserine/homoserine lactone efflux protein